MPGLTILSEEEKQEMIEDGSDKERGKVFNAARSLSQQGSLDDYIDFLSANMDFAQGTSFRKITKNFRL
ncbi:MAG: hypothetical protein JRI99_13330 [Deltaproteobacteria bacterium]|nr:hypothetical protein [Deltaproteobacteria bacterium]